jgi:hypothetical protein
LIKGTKPKASGVAIVLFVDPSGDIHLPYKLGLELSYRLNTTIISLIDGTPVPDREWKRCRWCGTTKQTERY